MAVTTKQLVAALVSLNKKTDELRATAAAHSVALSNQEKRTSNLLNDIRDVKTSVDLLTKRKPDDEASASTLRTLNRIEDTVSNIRNEVTAIHNLVQPPPPKP